MQLRCTVSAKLFRAHEDRRERRPSLTSQELVTALMEITALSGATVVQLEEEELDRIVASGNTVGDLKKLLASRIGYSRFRLKLLNEDMGELQDDMPVTQLLSVQLVMLDFCAPEEAVWEALLLACKGNRVDEVTSLLQKPLNPNSTGADADHPPIYLAAERGHLEVVRLLLEAGDHKKKKLK